jgi:hypothetical protein
VGYKFFGLAYRSDHQYYQPSGNSAQIEDQTSFTDQLKDEEDEGLGLRPTYHDS